MSLFCTSSEIAFSYPIIMWTLSPDYTLHSGYSSGDTPGICISMIGWFSTAVIGQFLKIAELPLQKVFEFPEG